MRIAQKPQGHCRTLALVLLSQFAERTAITALGGKHEPGADAVGTAVGVVQLHSNEE